MKACSALVLLMLIPGSALAAKQPPSPAKEDLWVPGFPSLPPDARQVVERLAACSHFSGEFNGNRSTRDKEVSAAEARLRCETIEQDAAAIDEKYAGNRSVQDALVAASQL